jgi:hypothetical protein
MGYCFFRKKKDAGEFIDQFYDSLAHYEFDEIAACLAPVEAFARPRNGAGNTVIAEPVILQCNGLLLRDRENQWAYFFVRADGTDPKWLEARTLKSGGKPCALPYKRPPIAAGTFGYKNNIVPLSRRAADKTARPVRPAPAAATQIPAPAPRQP